MTFSGHDDSTINIVLGLLLLLLLLYIVHISVISILLTYLNAIYLLVFTERR